MSVTNALIKTALDHVSLHNPTFFQIVNRSGFEASLQEALDEVLPKNVTLASDKPDFEDIIFAFVQELQTDQAWKDIVHTGTGQTLLRNISSGISFLHFAIVRAVQNTLLLPGSSKESVYQGMNFLGVNVRRKIPQRLSVRLTIPDHDTPFTIPAFTQFNINGEFFFNRKPITYSVFELFKETTLYQGVLYSKEGTAAGIPFETYEVGYENFSISNEDVYVFINNEEWQRDVKLRPWMASRNQKVFFTKTLGTGNISIMFGNNLYGKKLELEDEIKIQWAETRGLEAQFIQSEVNFALDTLNLPVTGLTLSGSFGGDNEPDIKLYQNVGHHIMASSGVGIRRSDFVGLALEYPNVKDALFRGQAEMAPNLRTFQNMVGVTLLTGEHPNIMNEYEWDEFVDYMSQRSVFALKFIRQDPIVVDIDVYAKVFCSTKANLNEIRSVLVNAIVDYTRPRKGALGYSIYASDIISILEGNLDKAADGSIAQNYTQFIEYVSDFRFDYTDQEDSEPEEPEEELEEIEPDVELGDEPETEIEVDNDDPGVDESFVGITDDGEAVLAGYMNYIKIVNVNLDLAYTPRRTYVGRNDLKANA